MVLLQTSAESETRTLAVIGLVLVLCALAVTGFIVINPLAGKAPDRVALVIDTPYVVQGVVPGTAVISHGVEIGKVTGVSKLSGGGVQLIADLQKKAAAKLTDAMQIDFRPANYFGVTGINITPVAGGQALRDGMRMTKTPKGNFTLQAMLSRLGELSNKVITPQMISVIDKATRYTDGLDPLIETMMIAANAVAEVQTVPTAQLLANTTGLSVAFPGFLNSLTDAATDIAHGDTNFIHKGMGDLTDDEWSNQLIPTLEQVSNGIFASLGRLEASHVADLLPLVNGLQAITDTAPPLLRPDGLAQMLVELRTRFEKLYAGTPEQRALQVRIVLDSLPGVAAPLGVQGTP
ncbi:MlaD family protein [Mycolicibacterium septicum]|uniref:MlaD family protein n=1 Tax=Mycolicibacterium septicum TaxID=98668 RepID=UPI0023611E74|nr:MlaD family protein [Mycolicibacterium septicum]